MSKFKVDVDTGNGKAKAAAAPAAEAEPEETAADSSDASDFMTTATTIGAVAVVAALVDVALIPGIAIGVVAAFAPKFMPKLGERLEPLFNSTVRGAYKLTRRARVAVAEAQERMNDIAAEVDAEAAAEATEPSATPA